MNVQTKLPLDADWKDRLGIGRRLAPDFYETSIDLSTAQHASAIRVALDDLGLSAVFCVQGVPTVGIVVSPKFDRAAVLELHAKLWNQGLISLLLVIADDTLRAYSLMRTPRRDGDADFDNRCLIEALSITEQALKFQNLIFGAESGRLWWEHQDKFRPKERVDQVLLDNLTECHRQLSDPQHFGDQALTSEAAQALLIQTMFVAYLEDRGILTSSYFQSASGGSADSFQAILSTGNTTQLKDLFQSLKKDFNGDVFVAPCSFEPGTPTQKIEASHLGVLAAFRPGREDIANGQLRFWGYDFRYIPVELISAVYDRFLGEREAERRDKGAYYTPMFLVDTVIAQVWDGLDEQSRDSGEILDPACGSAVFLVRMFQRLCEHMRSKRGRNTVSWADLLRTLSRLHGWDINGNAVRVAIFSLYVALLEEVTPRDIQQLVKKGRLLPELWGKSLVAQDFFEVAEENRFALVIGNPPWSSRRGGNRTSAAWSKAACMPIPGNEDSWAFAWKALRHVKDSGKVAFLLPAMGFLHNHAEKTVKARNRFFLETDVQKIINFADLRFQLFDKAHRPTALLIFGSRLTGAPYRRFDYWAPKANLNLRIKRVLTLSTADKMTLSVEQLLDNPLVFKQRLWMREPDAKLFGYLDRFSKISDLVIGSRRANARGRNDLDNWVVGQGFQPYSPDAAASGGAPSESDLVGILPQLDIGHFHRLAQSSFGLSPAPSRSVRRKGFEAGFEGARILIPRGVDSVRMRLRASFCSSPLTFQDILQAITIPEGDEFRGKLLAAILNSRLAAWFAFHGTSSFGADRPEIKQVDLLSLPFPNPQSLPDPEVSQQAADELVRIIDSSLMLAEQGFTLESDTSGILERIDALSYTFFGLSDEEKALIEDTMETIVPSIQPHESKLLPLWRSPDARARASYAKYLAARLQGWVKSDEVINTKLFACARDLAVLQLSFAQSSIAYEEVSNGSVAATLSELAEQIKLPLSGNFQLTPDIRILANDSLYLVKPMQMRFWLRSAALADADAIAFDLQDAINLQRRANA